MAAIGAAKATLQAGHTPQFMRRPKTGPTVPRTGGKDVKRRKRS